MNPQTQETLEKLRLRFNLDLEQKQMPIEIPNTDRETLASLFWELGLNRGVELGVEQGLYSETLCKANPNIQLFSVDAWTAYKGYRDHVSQSKIDGFHEKTLERLSPYNVTVIKGFSMDIVKQFSDESLDFVYIDGNHEFKQTVDDITEWAKKVRSGGIIAGHDFIRRKNPEYLMHVIEAVEGYTSAWKIKPWFVLGRKDKIEGERRDQNRSWFFVKP